MQSVSKKIPIGYVSIIDYDLGYGLLPEYWNKGIITESCRKVIDTVQDTLPFLTATHPFSPLPTTLIMPWNGNHISDIVYIVC